jgi:hypothetical protein
MQVEEASVAPAAAPSPPQLPPAAEPPAAAANGRANAPKRAVAANPKQGKAHAKPGFGGALTMADISKDGLTQLAQSAWSSAALASGGAAAFDPSLVERVYAEELGGGSAPAARRVALLELSQYLENYLWTNFDPEAASPVHVLSIVAMVNEKFREGVPAWDCFAAQKVSLLTAVRVVRWMCLFPAKHSSTPHPSHLPALCFFPCRATCSPLCSRACWHSGTTRS